MTKTTTANYKDFSLVDGGVIYAATSIFRRGKNKSLGLPKTALAMIFFTWGVMCILAIIDGTLNDTDQTISFFEDFMIHVRFLFVLPFLILIDNVVDKAFVGYIQDVDKLIPNDEQPKFDKFIKFINRLTDS